MTRLVVCHANPYGQAVKMLAAANYDQVFTRSRLAARALQVRHQSLSALARKHLERSGRAIAPMLTTQTLLRQVVQEITETPDALGTARAWMPTVRSLLQSSPSLDVAAVDGGQRAAQLLQVAQQYQVALRQQGWVDQSELYWRAAECGPIPCKTLIYGYFQPQLDELAWINAMSAPGSVLFLPASDVSLFADIHTSLQWLRRQGWQVVVDPGQPQAEGMDLGQRFVAGAVDQPNDCARAYGYSTVDAEVRGTLAQVKQLLHAGVPARDLAIVARDETTYGPHLIDIAWEYGVPLRALYDTPLLSTRLGAWLALLLQVIDQGLPFEATARLLSHPLCSNPDGGFWAAVRGQHPQGWGGWQAIATELLQLDLQALSQANQTRRRDTWISWWQALFITFDLRRRCARWARESIAFNRLDQALVELSRPEAEPLSWLEMRQQLEDLLALLTVPAQPGRGGVELHKPSSLAGARYAHVFVVGMAEGILPAPIGNDPVLDFFERQQLRSQGIILLGAAELARCEALTFYGLLQTVTGQITFSYPKLRERQELLPSPYLERLGLQATAAESPLIASPEELRRVWLRQDQPLDDEVLQQARQAFTVEQRRESSEPPDEYDGVIGMLFDYSDWTFSVSQLTSLGQCPFRWFANKLLRLGEPPEADEDLSPSLRGLLYHKVLELLVIVVQADPALKLTDPVLLRQTFLAAETAVHLPALPAWDLRREEHLRCLSLCLSEPSFWPEQAEPVVLEQIFRGEWQGLQVTGRVDRIDRTPNGVVLIDYKTSGSVPKGVKDSNGKASIDLQLPLYRAVAAPYFCPDEPASDAYYFSLTKGTVLRPAPKAPQHELPAVIERCKRQLDAGCYPVQPDVDQDACRYCDLDWVCRRGNRLNRKEKTHGTD